MLALVLKSPWVTVLVNFKDTFFAGSHVITNEDYSIGVKKIRNKLWMCIDRYIYRSKILKRRLK